MVCCDIAHTLSLTISLPSPPHPTLSPLQEWKAELAAAMKRVMDMRKLLRAALEAKGTPGSWAHITSQIGMFSYTGLTKAQSERMTNEFHIYSAWARM